MKNKTPWDIEWTKKYDDSFQKFKKTICQILDCTAPNSQTPFITFIDAFKFTIRDCLAQTYKDEQSGLQSKKLSKAQEIYTIIKKNHMPFFSLWEHGNLKDMVQISGSNNEQPLEIPERMIPLRAKLFRYN